MATHYWVDGVWVTTIKVTEINEAYVKLSIEGSVDVEHQYGSDFDMTNGNGAHFGDSYPFSVNVEIDVNNPMAIKIVPSEISVDVSQFYGPVDDEIYDP